MSYVTPQQLAHMRLITAPTLVDTCQRLVYGSTDDGYGYGSGYTDGASTECLFVPRAEPDAQEGTVPMVDADLYLPLDFQIGSSDRVTITHLGGEAVANPQTFAIVGGPVIDRALIHAELRLVTE
jgi:hypothetical protein